MIIRLVNDMQVLTLCDGSNRTAGQSCGPASLTYSAAPQVQVSAFLRAHNAKPRYRGNVVEQIGFEISRLHASFDAAWAWLAEHRREIQDFQDCSAELETSDSVITSLDDCVASIAGASITGCSVRVQYTIIGSKLSVGRGPKT